MLHGSQKHSIDKIARSAKTKPHVRQKTRLDEVKQLNFDISIRTYKLMCAALLISSSGEFYLLVTEL